MNHILKIAVAAAMSTAVVPSTALALDLNSPIECIAPGAVGGGWDWTCRALASALSKAELIPGQMQVTNMPGGSGAIGWSNVAGKRSRDENLILSTSTTAVSNITLGKYPGDLDTMKWVGSMATDVAVIVVTKDSDLKTLSDLLEKLKTEPESVVVGGSDIIGGWDHLRYLQVVESAGVPVAELPSMPWVYLTAGSSAITQMMGGAVDVVVTDLAEAGQFIEAGDVRALAILSDERLDRYPDSPTAIEQGFQVTGYNWRGFYVPGGISEEQYQQWVDLLANLSESPVWEKTVTDAGLEPQWIGGNDFQTFIKETYDKVGAYNKALGF